MKKIVTKAVVKPIIKPATKTIANNIDLTGPRQPYYIDLTGLFREHYNFNLKRCPRCGGPIFWYYLHCDPYGQAGAKDKMKCFSCGRYFVLVTKNSRNNGTYVWKQYPDRDEEYAVVEEKLPAKK